MQTATERQKVLPGEMQMTATTRDIGMIFTGESVLASLTDRKTMTRRLVKPQHLTLARGCNFERDWPTVTRVVLRDGRFLPMAGKFNVAIGELKCPYPVGSRIWVREAFCQAPPMRDWVQSCRIAYRADGKCVGCGGDGDGGWMQVFHGWLHPDVQNKGPALGRTLYGRWKSPLHMPRWASRLTLEVVEVRVERLQEISFADIQAEGFAKGVNESSGPCRERFEKAWDRINPKHPWASNPWVWVIRFRRLEGA